MQNIRIINGTYRLRGIETDMSGHVFPMAKEFTLGTSGGAVTVDATPITGLPNRNIKIKCNSPEDYELVGEDVKTSVREESDAETIERIRERFDMLKDMTKAVKKGDVRAMIVSGPPGVGKSHGVEEVLDRYNTVAALGGGRKYEVVKGAMSPIGLYVKLYNYKEKDQVLVFDDCDAIFEEPLALNILKAALDSKKRRTIHWNTDSFKLRNEGVPDSFEFKGSAIFITNLDFQDVKSKKIKSHLEALESRCHYMDLTITTEREKMLRIAQVIKDGMLDAYTLSDEVKEEIIDFVDMNKKRLRELSLRTVLKVADLAVAFPSKWEAMAENTVMKR